jgi:hypothetical protein
MDRMNAELDKIKTAFDEKINQLLKLIEKRAIQEDLENLERRTQD